MAAAAERRRPLQHLADLRERREHDPVDEQGFSATTRRIDELQSITRKEKRTQFKERWQALEHELHEADVMNNKLEVQRLSRALAFMGVGIKRRRH